MQTLREMQIAWSSLCNKNLCPLYNWGKANKETCLQVGTWCHWEKSRSKSEASASLSGLLTLWQKDSAFRADFLDKSLGYSWRIVHELPDLSKWQEWFFTLVLFGVQWGFFCPGQGLLLALLCSPHILPPAKMFAVAEGLCFDFDLLQHRHWHWQEQSCRPRLLYGANFVVSDNRASLKMSFGAICGVSLTSLTTAGMRVLQEDLAHVGGGTLSVTGEARGQVFQQNNFHFSTVS